jgi:hypothetical protein
MTTWVPAAISPSQWTELANHFEAAITRVRDALDSGRTTYRQHQQLAGLEAELMELDGEVLESAPRHMRGCPAGCWCHGIAREFPVGSELEQH